MDLLPTEEQQQIIDTAKAFLDKEFPVSAALQLPEGQERFRTSDLARIADLGWLGIGLEEKHSGIGYGLCEESLLFVELGRALMPPSLIGSVLGARVAAVSGLDGVASDILAGRAAVATALPRNTSEHLVGGMVDGEFIVLDAKDADFVLLVNESAAALVDIKSLQHLSDEACMDPLITATRYGANKCNAAALLAAGEDAIFHRGALLCSALLLGIAEATLDRSVTYAREREQYGKPIGSFQSIKHYCADMAIRCESLKSMLYHASITLDQDGAAGLFDLHTTRALAIDIATLNANTAVQIHGGMGYTEEMDIHLFVKRAQVLATLFGSERYHLRELLKLDRPD